MSWPIEHGDRLRKLLLVQRKSFRRSLQRVLISGFELANVVQDLFSFGDSIVVRGQVGRIMKQQIVAFGAPRLQHFNGGLLRKRCRGCVNVHDAVDDPTHTKKIVHGHKNYGREYDSDDGQAKSRPATQRVARRKNLEGSRNSYSHDLSSGRI